MGTLSIKSLLTSLCQREAIYPSLAKRGSGRFSGQCGFTYELLSNYDKEKTCNCHGLFNQIQ
jgi:hypothetical protein